MVAPAAWVAWAALSLDDGAVVGTGWLPFARGQQIEYEAAITYTLDAELQKAVDEVFAQYGPDYGVFAALEDEMCRFGTDGLTASPDRVDALVWAVSALVIEPRGVPRLRAV